MIYFYDMGKQFQDQRYNQFTWL